MKIGKLFNLKKVNILNQIFYCYSPKLKNELLKHGEQYIAKNLHPTTKRFYWLFLKNDKLIEYLNKRKQESDLM